MKTIRVVKRSEVTQAVLDNLDQFGFTLIYMETEIRIMGA